MSKGTKAFLIALLMLVAVAGIVVGGGWWWVDQQVSGTPGEGEPVEFEIPEGSGAASIGESLAEQDVIRNSLAFRILARTRGVDDSFSAGTYELETGMSVDEVLAALGEGPLPPEMTRVTIPEGLTVDQTLARLSEATQFDEAEFRDVLQATRQDPSGGPLRLPEWMPPLDQFPEDVQVFEGLLFPKTYQFDPDEVTPASVLQTLIDQTEVAMASASPTARENAEASGIDPYRALIIASLIEREARVPGEWREIAAVIRNRLDDGMLLQIDATLLYAAGNPEGGPSAVDTEVESPYNTYQNAGLPPTPIAGARPEAIQAAFNPAETPYLYYVVSPECDGSHRFAETLEGHNQNVQAYRDAGRCQ